MQCYIYRSSIKEGLYVYIAEENGLEKLPEPVLKQLGTPEFSMKLDLHDGRKLIQENTLDVIESLKTRGFHIQMPRDIEDQLQAIANNANHKRQTP
ncbi:MAG: YcgL domain-containing protein [Granulosicoccus sp.]